jgi:hypothetical protein
LPLDQLLLSSASTLIEPLQDWPQTASALRLWQHANRTLVQHTNFGYLDQNKNAKSA